MIRATIVIIYLIGVVYNLSFLNDEEIVEDIHNHDAEQFVKVIALMIIALGSWFMWIFTD